VPANFFTPNFIRLPLAGDFDRDGDVDLADYGAVEACLRVAGHGQVRAGGEGKTTPSRTAGRRSITDRIERYREQMN